MNAGISIKNRQILDELNRTQTTPFSAKNVAKILGLSLKNTAHLLTYFATKGWLSRIRRGVYITVPLGTINAQEYTINPWIIAQEIFAPCYIAGWSAAEHWEFTDQIFNSVLLISTRKQRTKYHQIKKAGFVVKYVSEKYFGKTKSLWIDNVKIFISDPIQTIVDILDDPYLGGGIRSVSDIMQEYFLSQHRNDTEIISYIDAKNNKTIYKRLGYLIETINIQAPELLEICKKQISSGFTLLDPAIEHSGSYNTHWNLRINARIVQ
ncbi:MAG: hypothetical protein KAT71_02200 [Gammaproteobacteria bacterium]|nr:hypothetical protein [Gammaproteobacteria bacterium]